MPKDAAGARSIPHRACGTALFRSEMALLGHDTFIPVALQRHETSANPRLGVNRLPTDIRARALLLALHPRDVNVPRTRALFRTKVHSDRHSNTFYTRSWSPLWSMDNIITPSEYARDKSTSPLKIIMLL